MTTSETNDDIESVTLSFDIPLPSQRREDGTYPVIPVSMEAKTVAKAVLAMEFLRDEGNDGLVNEMAKFLVQGTMIELEGLDTGILEDIFARSYNPFRIFILPMALWDDVDNSEMEVVLGIVATSANAALEAFDIAASPETLAPFIPLGYTN